MKNYDLVTTERAEGSLRDLQVAQGTSLQNVFYYNVEKLLILDTSGSMDQIDFGYTTTRHDRADEQLRNIQKEFPGKVGLIEFSSEVYFRPDGIPWRLNGGTELNKALKFVKPVDGTGIDLIVISDGDPFYPQECLRLAREFTSKIHTIFIGGENDSGRDFLKKLSDLSGGTYQYDGAGIMEAPVKRLMKGA